jgi:hypothetical protein
MSNYDINEDQLRAIYAWIDGIPLSRPKRNITRDFSDGVMFAEVVHAYFPHMVELHNYTPAHAIKQKIYNFETLNLRTLKKLGYIIPPETIEDIVNCKPGAVEYVLNSLQFKMAKYREKRSTSTGRSNSSTPSKERVVNITHTKSTSNLGISNTDDPTKKTTGSKVKPSQGIHNLSNKIAQHSTPSTLQINQGPTISKKNNLPTVNEEILLEKEQQIRELTETVEILELKIAKLEQLLRLKDNKIQKLMQR